MQRSTKRVGIRSLAIGLTVTAASVAPMWTLASGAAAKGSDPGNKICTLTKSQLASTTKTSTALEKALLSGNWAVAKKALLASFGGEKKLQQQAVAAYSGAPANVKATEPVLLGLVKTEEQLVQSSTSATQFESSFEAAIESPKYAAAEKTEAAYYTKVCGPIT
jgi:hypothetical protein